MIWSYILVNYRIQIYDLGMVWSTIVNYVFNKILLQMTLFFYYVQQFVCLVQSCDLKFTTAEERKLHLVKIHQYPKEYRFDRRAKNNGWGQFMFTLSVCLSLSLFVCLSVSLSVSLSVGMSCCLFVTFKSCACILRTTGVIVGPRTKGMINWICLFLFVCLFVFVCVCFSVIDMCLNVLCLLFLNCLCIINKCVYYRCYWDKKGIYWCKRVLRKITFSVAFHFTWM